MTHKIRRFPFPLRKFLSMLSRIEDRAGETKMRNLLAEHLTLQDGGFYDAMRDQAAIYAFWWFAYEKARFVAENAASAHSDLRARYTEEDSALCRRAGHVLKVTEVRARVDVRPDVVAARKKGIRTEARARAFKRAAEAVVQRGEMLINLSAGERKNRDFVASGRPQK